MPVLLVHMLAHAVDVAAGQFDGELQELVSKLQGPYARVKPGEKVPEKQRKRKNFTKSCGKDCFCSFQLELEGRVRSAPRYFRFSSSSCWDQNSILGPQVEQMMVGFIRIIRILVMNCNILSFYKEVSVLLNCLRVGENDDLVQINLSGIYL